MEEDNEARLWDEYINFRSARNRNKLFAFYLGWAKKISTIQFSRLGNTSLTWSDSVQIGSLALLESLERFKPTMGVPFEGFAIKRIKGALFNEAARGRRVDGNHVVDFVDEAQVNSDFDAFVDSVLDIAYSGLLEVVSRKSVGNMDELLENFIGYREEVFVQEAVSSLPEEMRFIIESHYFNCLTFVQIAEILGLSRARVSQLHRKALHCLRKQVGDIS